jgi:DNA mismatch repair protein MutS2
MLELEGGLRVETNAVDLEQDEAAEHRPRAGAVTWTTGDFEPVLGEIMVRGLERVEALERVDRFLDRAVLQGLQAVTIIHGVGKGILKQAIYDMLRKDPRVADVHPGEPARGGDGVAVVRLK